MSEQLTHWKKTCDRTYLGSWDLDNGNGYQDIIATIDYISEDEVFDPQTGGKKMKTVAHFKEDIKPMILNKTNKEAIALVSGEMYVERWKNLKVQISVEKVKSFGKVDDALRIKKSAPKQESAIKCEQCSNPIKSTNSMNAQQVADYTKNKYGQALCADCATKANKALKEQGEAKNDTVEKTE